MTEAKSIKDHVQHVMDVLDSFERTWGTANVRRGDIEGTIEDALKRVREEAIEQAAKICAGKEARQQAQAHEHEDEGDDEGSNGCWHAASLLGEAAAAIRALSSPPASTAHPDPTASGMLHVPHGIDGRHVLLADNTWQLRSELSPYARIREFGGCAMLGSGQLVPMESIMREIPEPPAALPDGGKDDA